MKPTKFLVCIALSWLGLTALPEAAAAAPGVVLDKSELAAGDRATLGREIAKARSANPAVFAQVAKSVDLAKEADETSRGRHASISRPLYALGPLAVMPMLEMLAVDGPPRGKLSDGAWLTLRVGLLEAVGKLRDARSRSVLVATLRTSNEFEIVRAAAEALARLNDDKAAKHLASLVKQPGDKQIAVLNGIGECRRAIVADALAGIAAKTPADMTLALSVIKALGSVGNAWAWQTPAIKKTGEGPRVRATSVKALLKLFVAYDGHLRQKATKAILAVDDPSTLALIEDAKRGASADRVSALDRLAAEVANSPIR